jgi:Zinc-binding dehydrogenase
MKAIVQGRYGPIEEVLRPVIDRTVPLAEAAAAIAHVASGHDQGTTVITMAKVGTSA